MNSTQWMPSSIYDHRAEVRPQSSTNTVVLIVLHSGRWLPCCHRTERVPAPLWAVWWAGAELGLDNSPHLLHSEGPLLPWILWGLLRSDLCQRVLPHSVHLWGLSPLWIPWCWMKPVLPGKAFSHSAHLWSLPLWIPRCFVRTALRKKAFPHSAH